MNNKTYLTTKKINKAGNENKTFADEVIIALNKHMAIVEHYYSIGNIYGDFFDTSLGKVCISTVEKTSIDFEIRIKFFGEAIKDITELLDINTP